MSVNKSDEDCSSSKNADEIESPRKRLCLDNSARKSWSLMDRRTDQEVLQEMGVSLLEPDENEQCDLGTSMMHQHKALKRKRDIENMNPNVNSSLTSPRPKYSPKSPKSRSKMCYSSPGPSKGKSPRSSEKKHSPLFHDDSLNTSKEKTDLEASCYLDKYLIDEETPLAQSVAGKYCDIQLGSGFGSNSATSGKKAGAFTLLGLEEHILSRRRTKSEPQGTDSFEVLSDEMMLSVFKWLPKRTLAHCMLVCKRWYRVACDETLWQRLDLGNKTLSKNALGRILARKPAVVRLANSEIGEWRPTGTPVPSRIQYLDLSISTIDLDTLDCLLERCPALKKLSLENIQLRDTTCELIGRCKNLETLNLTMADGITAEGLSFITNGCNNLLSLNISWCNLNEAALEVLVTSLPPRLQRLNVGGARIMTNDMVKSLVDRCPRLLELDLSDCSQLGVDAIQKVQDLTRLDHLALSRCYLLPPHALTKLSSMPSLQFLDVWGMLPSKSLSALRAALPAIQINQFMFSAIARPTVGAKRTSIWGLRTRD